MANMLRPWLAPLLRQEMEAALSWKQGQLDRKTDAKVKAERADEEALSDLDSDGDLLYSDDGSNLRMSVTRELSSGHNSFLQIVQFNTNNEAPQVVLSDGHTSVRARLLQDAVKRFEGMHNLRVTEISGGIIHPSAFQIVATPYGMQEKKVTLDVESFRYRKGSRYIGSVGHPRNAASDLDIQKSLDRLAELQIKALGDPSSASSASKPNPEHIDDQSSVHSEAHDVVDLTEEALPQSQTGTPTMTFESQNVFATQAQNPGSAFRQQPRAAPEISLAQGTNLARPVALPRTVNDTAAQLLRSLGRQVPPQPFESGEDIVPQAQPIQEVHVEVPQETLSLQDEPSTSSILQAPLSLPRISPVAVEQPASAFAHISMHDAVDTTGGDSPIEHRDCQVVAEHNVTMPQVDAQEELSPIREIESVRHVDEEMNVDKREPSSVKAPVPEEPERGVPDPRYIFYARKHLPLEQQKLITSSASWLPSEPGETFVTSNIPVSLLRQVSDTSGTAFGRTSLHGAFVTALRDALQEDNVEEVSEDSSSSQVSPDEDDRPLSWPSSPYKGQSTTTAEYLPPDSSAHPPLVPNPAEYLPPDGNADVLPSSSPPLAGQAMDIDADSDDSVLPESVPRPLISIPKQRAPDVVIKGSQAEEILSKVQMNRVPTSTYQSTVPDSAERPKGRPNPSSHDTIAKRPRYGKNDADHGRTKRSARSAYDWGEDEHTGEDPRLRLNKQKSERFRQERQS